MATGTLFGIVTSASSSAYTELAINSFFKNTVLNSKDKVILIDNDSVWPPTFALIECIKNPNPQSFSQNVNLLLNIANNNDLDLVFLSNDVILTPGWLHPLELNSNILTIPTCNQTHKYSLNGFDAFEELNIENYLGHYEDLCRIVEHHRSEMFSPTFERGLMPFYAFRIPKEIYRTVGYFDENFINGGEDIDYRIRTLAAGFDVKYMTQSYLLHFNGKSTWRGPEGKQQIIERTVRYKSYFKDKWGLDMLKALTVDENTKEVIDKYNAAELTSYNEFIKLMLKERK